jgi:hypothetical protein
MKREMNLASALHEALKFTDKGRRIKTVDFIHAAAHLGIFKRTQPVWFSVSR